MRFFVIASALLSLAVLTAEARLTGVTTCKGSQGVTIDWDHQIVTIDGTPHAMQFDKLGKHAGFSFHGDGITINVVKGKDGAKPLTVMLTGGREVHLDCGRHRRQQS